MKQTSMESNPATNSLNFVLVLQKVYLKYRFDGLRCNQAPTEMMKKLTEHLTIFDIRRPICMLYLNEIGTSTKTV